MKTIKVIGGGPLVGRTFYGEKVDETADQITVKLDELIHPQEKPHTVFHFSTQTGYLKVAGGETDLLRVA